ncbi:hypothetical protein KDN24_02180 [Bacillus sp. Bva_UNVM-123]|uniref:hypothetical protein n=1 Tax=Bacillus sp. Bva_UNVM-123 TaxID=2829798 RepID=UPI00391F7407
MLKTKRLLISFLSFLVICVIPSTSFASSSELESSNIQLIFLENENMELSMEQFKTSELNTEIQNAITEANSEEELEDLFIDLEKKGDLEKTNLRGFATNKCKQVKLRVECEITAWIVDDFIVNGYYDMTWFRNDYYLAPDAWSEFYSVPKNTVHPTRGLSPAASSGKIESVVSGTLTGQLSNKIYVFGDAWSNTVDFSK